MWDDFIAIDITVRIIWLLLTLWLAYSIGKFRGHQAGWNKGIEDADEYQKRIEKGATHDGQ